MDIAKIASRLKGILLSDPAWGVFIDALEVHPSGDIQFLSEEYVPANISIVVRIVSAGLNEYAAEEIRVITDVGASSGAANVLYSGGAESNSGHVLIPFLPEGTYEILTPGVTSLTGSNFVEVLKVDPEAAVQYSILRFSEVPEGIDEVVITLREFRAHGFYLGKDKAHLFTNNVSSYFGLLFVNSLLELSLDDLKFNEESLAEFQYDTRLYVERDADVVRIYSPAYLYGQQGDFRDVVYIDDSHYYPVLGYCNGLVSLDFSGIQLPSSVNGFIDVTVKRYINYYNIGPQDTEYKSSDLLLKETAENARPMMHESKVSWRFNVSLYEPFSISWDATKAPLVIYFSGNDYFGIRIVGYTSGYPIYFMSSGGHVGSLGLDENGEIDMSLQAPNSTVSLWFDEYMQNQGSSRTFIIEVKSKYTRRTLTYTGYQIAPRFSISVYSSVNQFYNMTEEFKSRVYPQADQSTVRGVLITAESWEAPIVNLNDFYPYTIRWQFPGDSEQVVQNNNDDDVAIKPSSTFLPNGDSGFWYTSKDHPKLDALQTRFNITLNAVLQEPHSGITAIAEQVFRKRVFFWVAGSADVNVLRTIGKEGNTEQDWYYFTFDIYTNLTLEALNVLGRARQDAEPGYSNNAYPVTPWGTGAFVKVQGDLYHYQLPMKTHRVDPTNVGSWTMKKVLTGVSSLNNPFAAPVNLLIRCPKLYAHITVSMYKNFSYCHVKVYGNFIKKDLCLFFKSASSDEYYYLGVLTVGTSQRDGYDYDSYGRSSDEDGENKEWQGSVQSTDPPTHGWALAGTLSQIEARIKGMNLNIYRKGSLGNETFNNGNLYVGYMPGRSDYPYENVDENSPRHWPHYNQYSGGSYPNGVKLPDGAEITGYFEWV